jgi:hypothetical protein
MMMKDTVVSTYVLGRQHVNKKGEKKEEKAFGLWLSEQSVVKLHL